MSPVTVGLIGCGRMGVPIARRLREAGYDVAVCRRGRSAEIVRMGGRIAGDGSAAAVARAAGIVLTCLPSAAALRDVANGPGGLLGAMGSDSLVIELSTLAIADKEAARAPLAAAGAEMLDVPVSGTPAMVPAGRLTAYASGEGAALLRARPVLEAFAGRVIEVGAFGMGCRVKFLASLLVAVHTCAAAEVIALARRAGLDAGLAARALIESPAATSGMFSARAQMMAAASYPEPAMGTVDVLRKDLEQAHAMAVEAGSATPLLDAARALCDVAREGGAGEADIARLVDFIPGDR